MKILKETNVGKRLNEDYAKAIADIYDRDPEPVEDVINQFMKGVGKKDLWNRPDVTNLDVDEGLRKILDPAELTQLYSLVKEGGGTDPSNVVGKIIDILVNDGTFKSVTSFQEAEVMTRNKGFVVRIGNKTFQFELLGS